MVAEDMANEGLAVDGGDSCAPAVKSTFFRLKQDNYHVSVDEQTIDDRSLMVRVTQGDEGALSELYDHYSRLVFSVAYHLLGRRELAEDVTLETFTRVWERAHTYDPDRSQVSTWLTHIARYRAIDLLRRESSRPEGNSIRWTDLSFELPGKTHNPESHAQMSLQRQRVRTAIAALPEEQQAALALAYFQGLTHGEVAEILGEPLGTVKGRIRAAMQKLRYSLWDE